jgi:hypothetical protein
VESLVASNLNALANEKARFQNPEEDLKKPFEAFRPGGSLQGVGAPLMQRAPSSGVNSKRLKELLEKRQEWPFLEPEDYQTALTVEEVFGIPEYGPNGEVKERKSPLERYYERLGHANTATNRTRNDGLFGMGFIPGKKNDGRNKDLNLTGTEDEPGATPEIDNPLKQLLRGNPPGNPLFPETTKPGGFSDVFGQVGQWNTESTEATRAQAARQEEFKRILDFRTLPTLPSSSPISGILPFDPLKPSSSTTPAFALPKSSDPAPTAPIAPVRDSLNPFPTTFGTVARPSELPEVSASLPGLAPSTPLPEPARPAVPVTDFNIPKRRF